MDTTFWQAVLYLHLIAMAFFLGGQPAYWWLISAE